MSIIFADRRAIRLEAEPRNFVAEARLSAPFEKRSIGRRAFPRPTHQEGMTLAGKPLQLRGRQERMQVRRHRTIDERTAVGRQNQDRGANIAKLLRQILGAYEFTLLAYGGGGT